MAISVFSKKHFRVIFAISKKHFWENFVVSKKHFIFAAQKYFKLWTIYTMHFISY
jgi:hypothetical protein